jgi:hypothetical protein
MLGEAYMSVRKEDEERREEGDYVKVETKSSRSREQQRTPK